MQGQVKPCSFPSEPEAETGKTMPEEGAAQQNGTFGNTENWVQSPALSLPSNVTLAHDCPQPASAFSQGSGGDVGATM